MKNTYFFLLTILFLVNSCRNNDAKSTTETALSSIDTTKTIGPAPEAPPINQAVTAIIDEQTAKSPFKDLGCCTDTEKRETETCCCDLVLEQYRKMRANPGKTNFGELKMHDPILSICRQKKKLRKAFDLIDNPAPPPPPAGKKASTDDLY
jgi:hypothetical protein